MTYLFLTPRKINNLLWHLLAKSLSSAGVKVWYDEFSLSVGDSLSKSIDRGLARSKFGVIVLSEHFISKPWPDYELRGLVSKEIGKDKVILPIWHEISRDKVLDFSPSLADKLALNTSIGLSKIAVELIRVIRPDIFDNLLRLKLYNEIIAKAEVKSVAPSEIKLGPIRHETLSATFLVRIKNIHHILNEVYPISLERRINLFRRDLNPSEEIDIWERIAAVYLEATQGKNFVLNKRRDIYAVALSVSLGDIDDEKAHKFENLTYEEVVKIVELCEGVVPSIDKSHDHENDDD